MLFKPLAASQEEPRVSSCREGKPPCPVAISLLRETCRVLDLSLAMLSSGAPGTEDQRAPGTLGIMAGPANSPYRSSLPGAIAHTNGPFTGPVWVWATAIDPDCAAQGPQTQRELNEFVREPKTDDFNQQGEKNDFMATVDGRRQRLAARLCPGGRVQKACLFFSLWPGSSLRGAPAVRAGLWEGQLPQPGQR